jgi:ADP-dependent NAD(P)H-hydrate dehydratase / NAD(P)H-hydrate epimerase
MAAVTTKLYSVAQVRELERRAIAAGTPGYALMQRAAAACWRELERRWPRTQCVGVICGSGNNGGDGYEIARLARAAGRSVQLLQLGAPPSRGDGQRAAEAWRAEGGSVQAFAPDALAAPEIIVDALFGIGLTRDLDGAALQAVQSINQSDKPVLAVDLPSGLDADRGCARGAAVNAHLTVSFIAPKLGLYTGVAADHRGELVIEDLGIDPVLYEGLPAVGRLLAVDDLRQGLPRRARSAHKGRHGHVLVIGGNLGMTGAALLAATGALRAGAGLVSVATRLPHAAALAAARPELMARGVETPGELATLLQHADVVAVGPGLGQDAWAHMVWSAIADCGLPRVVDADALNLLAKSPRQRADWVLTPHSGEAARLLGEQSSTVQRDRPAAVRQLRERYGGVAVLKGAGTLVQGEELALCADGNPGMAVGGMGDVLTGVIAGLLAQGLPVERAAQLGVLAHARAGDRAAQPGERGLLPSDLFAPLREQLNP